MVKPLSDRLYNLLPAIYRRRDAEPEQRQALRALMAIIEQQLLEVEADVDQLYDDWFIETCQEWLVPYIGELLAVRPLQPTNPQVSSQRAYVANTLSYRQRKGTAAVLEQLSRDVTGWPTRAVEFFERLAATQNLNHLRPQNFQTPDLRTVNALELLGGPFGTQNHRPEVRRIENGRGRYNIPQVGLYLWRLQSYPLAQVQARPVGNNPTTGLYWVSPLGQDAPLFNTPNPETAIAQLATEVNVPAPLRRRALHDEIAARVAGQLPPTDYFDATPPFEVWFAHEQANGTWQVEAIAPTDLCIANFSGTPGDGWQRPTLERQVAIDPVLGRLALSANVAEPPDHILVSHAYGFSGDIGGGPYDRRASLDLDFLERVDWQVGVSREAAPDGAQLFTSLAAAIAAWNALPPDGPQHGVIVLMDNLSDASGTTATAPLQIREASELLIIAADWPLRLDSRSGARSRELGRLAPTGRRAHLQGDLVVLGTAPPASRFPGRLMLNGLLIEGQLTVQSGHLGRLEIDHTTLVPAQGGLWVEPPLAAAPPAAADPDSEKLTPIPRLEIFVRNSITGPLLVADTVTRLTVTDSLIDAAAAGHVLITAPIALPASGINGTVRLRSGTLDTDLTIAATDLASAQAALATELQTVMPTAQVATVGDRLIVAGARGIPLAFTATATDTDTVAQLGLDGVAAAIAAPDVTTAAPPTRIERSTLLGSTYVTVMELGSEVIFAGIAYAQRRQQGCVRFSYIPPGSVLPRRYRCQPDLAIARTLAQLRQDKGEAAMTAQETRIRDRLQRQVVPVFTSQIYGQPAYGQLSRRCPPEIRTGADDDSEMGTFNFLKQPQREANLRVVLDEYLRFGLAAGLFFVT